MLLDLNFSLECPPNIQLICDEIFLKFKKVKIKLKTVNKNLKLAN